MILTVFTTLLGLTLAAQAPCIAPCNGTHASADRPIVLAQAKKAPAYPTFRKGTPYEAARKTLIAAGWVPVPPKGDSPCEEGDDRCKEMPELQECAGTGEGNCLFLWRRGETVLAVYSIDDPPLVTGVKCRAKCR